MWHSALSIILWAKIALKIETHPTIRLRVVRHGTFILKLYLLENVEVSKKCVLNELYFLKIHNLNESLNKWVITDLSNYSYARPDSSDGM